MDTLDDALLRPGRFDRKVTVGLPDAPARVSICAVHMRGKAIDSEVDPDLIARITPAFVDCASVAQSNQQSHPHPASAHHTQSVFYTTHTSPIPSVPTPLKALLAPPFHPSPKPDRKAAAKKRRNGRRYDHYSSSSSDSTNSHSIDASSSFSIRVLSEELIRPRSDRMDRIVDGARMSTKNLCTTTMHLSRTP